MPSKPTIYMDTHLEALTGARLPDETVSGIINRTAKRYLWIVAEAKLDLTETQARILGDVLSKFSAIDYQVVYYLAHYVTTATPIAGIALHEYNYLATAVDSSSFTERLATIESLGF